MRFLPVQRCRPAADSRTSFASSCSAGCLYGVKTEAQTTPGSADMAIPSTRHYVSTEASGIDGLALSLKTRTPPQIPLQHRCLQSHLKLSHHHTRSRETVSSEQQEVSPGHSPHALTLALMPQKTSWTARTVVRSQAVQQQRPQALQHTPPSLPNTAPPSTASPSSSRPGQPADTSCPALSWEPGEFPPLGLTDTQHAH
jgi:hypothetical protein